MRSYYLMSAKESYLIQPVIGVVLVVIAAALLLREGNWLEGRLVVKARPWQNWYLVAMAGADAFLCLLLVIAICAGGAFYAVFGGAFSGLGAVLGVALMELAFKACQFFCLLRTRRAGFIFALLGGPLLLTTLLSAACPAVLVFPATIAVLIFHYYCVLCGANRFYCLPPKLPPAPDDAQTGERDAAWEFTALSERLNRYSGLRASIAPLVIGGPEPAAIIPPPAVEELTEEEAARLAAEASPEEESDEACGPADDAEPVLVTGPLDDAEMPILPEEHALWARYRAHETLEPCAVTVRLEPDALPETVPDDLLAGSGLPRFLQNDARMQKLARRCWKKALADLRGYAAPPRGGAASGEARLRGRNQVWMVLRLQENPDPPHRAEAELHLNE